MDTNKLIDLVPHGSYSKIASECNVTRQTVANVARGKSDNIKVLQRLILEAELFKSLKQKLQEL